ncbi:MAG: hypothetical protein ACOYMQ_10290 [Pseudanabaena sp.]|jgi:hypothetical protein
MSDKKLDIIHIEECQAINYIKASTSEEVREIVRELETEFRKRLNAMRKEMLNQTQK